MTPEEKRRRRLKELAARLKKDKLSDLQKVRGWGALRWGCRMERVNEYLEVLAAAGLIEVGRASVTWVGGGDHE